LSEISSLITKGTTPTTIGKFYIKSGINFIKAESITDTGVFLKSKFSCIDDETDEMLKRSRIEEYDVLISIAGVIGRIAIATKSILPANTNQAIGIIRLKNASYNFFLYHHLKSSFVQQFISERIVQAVQANLSLGVIQSIPVIQPPKNIFNSFFKITSPLRELQIAMMSENESLTKLRDLLLPKLISGEISLSNNDIPTISNETTTHIPLQQKIYAYAKNEEKLNV
jgi:type I restriction enzyme S subunit